MEGGVTARLEREGRRDLLFFCSCSRRRGLRRAHAQPSRSGPGEGISRKGEIQRVPCQVVNGWRNQAISLLEGFRRIGMFRQLTIWLGRTGLGALGKLAPKCRHRSDE